MLFFRLNPYIAISILGVAYSLLASALWPIAALIIPEYQLGTAYGIMQVYLFHSLTFASILICLELWTRARGSLVTQSSETCSESKATANQAL